MDRRVVLFFMAFTLLIDVFSQENVTTLGVQFKPMVPSKFFGTGAQSASSEALTVINDPEFGMNLGMVVRRGLTKNWSFETGITFIQRNYKLSFYHPLLNEVTKMNYRFIGYEIPLQGMIYVRLGEQLYMNASAGCSIDMYPTNVESFADDRRDTLRFDFFQNTFRKNWIQFSVLANYGFEWRSKEDGYFYLGASFHRPFSEIATTVAQLQINSDPTTVSYQLNGSYLTFDFRYFFHEDPEKRKKVRKAS
jgi:hypothetical protein